MLNIHCLYNNITLIWAEPETYLQVEWISTESAECRLVDIKRWTEIPKGISDSPYYHVIAEIFTNIVPLVELYQLFIAHWYVYPIIMVRLIKLSFAEFMYKNMHIAYTGAANYSLFPHGNLAESNIIYSPGCFIHTVGNTFFTHINATYLYAQLNAMLCPFIFVASG